MHLLKFFEDSHITESRNSRARATFKFQISRSCAQIHKRIIHFCIYTRSQVQHQSRKISIRHKAIYFFSPHTGDIFIKSQRGISIPDLNSAFFRDLVPYWSCDDTTASFIIFDFYLSSSRWTLKKYWHECDFYRFMGAICLSLSMKSNYFNSEGYLGAQLCKVQCQISFHPDCPLLYALHQNCSIETMRTLRGPVFPPWALESKVAHKIRLYIYS